MSKENEVLTATPETAATTAPRPDETATRPQPVALEVPVTVNGARTVEGSDKREPFSETTKTVLVFGNGAVIRLSSPVAPGQLLFLTNEKTKKEVVCQVVKSKNYRSVSGYVELEFTESVVGFWGMRFPSDRVVQTSPTATSVPPAAATPKVVTPAAGVTPKVPEVKPAPVQNQAKPLAQPLPVQMKGPVPASSSSQPVPVQKAPAPVRPVAKRPEAPATPAVTIPSSTSSTSTKLPAQPLASSGNSTEELKQHTARLQEQLSSMLFTNTAGTKGSSSAPPAAASDSKAVTNIAAKIFEISKGENELVKQASPVKTIPPPPPLKSSLDTEEVKIPSWLEPLARNAAAPSSTQELVEREKAKHAAEVTAHEEVAPEPLPVAEAESAPEVELPAVGSLLPLDEDVATHDRPSSGSKRGIWITVAAAAIVLVAGGAWYLTHPMNGAQGAAPPVTRVTSAQTVPVPAATMPPASTQPASQNSIATSEPLSRPPTAEPVSSASVSSGPVLKPALNPQPVPVTRDNGRNSAATVPAAATERIPRAAAAAPPEPEPKRASLGDIHLAAPTVSRPTNAQEDGMAAPTIPTGNSEAGAAGLSSELIGASKQPAAPEVPLPVGGDVKPAVLISKVNAVYPALAKSQHVSGDVRIDALIDANGKVTTMKVIAGPTLLHQAAMDALRQWKYQPATLDGKPVPMHLTVTLQFRMQ